MAAIEEKIKNNKIISYKFKACLGRDENGKQIFKCSTWYPPAELTKAKSRKEAELAAAAWEAEVRQAYFILTFWFTLKAHKKRTNAENERWVLHCGGSSYIIRSV